MLSCIYRHYFGNTCAIEKTLKIFPNYFFFFFLQRKKHFISWQKWDISRKSRNCNRGTHQLPWKQLLSYKCGYLFLPILSSPPSPFPSLKHRLITTFNYMCSPNVLFDMPSLDICLCFGKRFFMPRIVFLFFSETFWIFFFRNFFYFCHCFCCCEVFFLGEK